ncbi:MAG: S8 family serine peptidase [Candidatus Thermoplasmatota archaeon]
MLVVFSTALLILSTLIVGVSAFEKSESAEKIVQVRLSDETELSELNHLDLEILERYESFALVKADGETIEQIESSEMDVNELPKRTQMTVKGHTFDIDEGPDLSSDLTIDGYEEGTEGLHLIHVLGPVQTEWRDSLEEEGVNLINYIPNYGYEVSMTPEEAEEVRSLDFVDWVGIYQPAYKLDSTIEEFIYSNSPNLERFFESKKPSDEMRDPEEVFGGVDITLRSRDDKRALAMIQNRILSSQDRIVRSVEKEEGFHKFTVSIDSIMEMERTKLKELFHSLAHMKDVYHVSPYIEPQLHGEMDSQIIGGGCWFMDDYSEPVEGDWREGNPNEPYRKFGDHGAYINQIGYDGDGVTIAIADTGMGDGTRGDAGHVDLKGRVVGGYGFGSPGYWADGHGHGTHTTGSAAAHGYNGTGETFEAAGYYKAQGLAYESELFATKIFDDGGGFIASDYYSIVEEPAQRSHSYIHSNSWGASTRGGYTETDEVFDQAVRDADRDSAENRPMVITASAGNNGARGDTTTGSPGNAKNVITIGATHTYNPPDGYENAENLASFSSRGWTEDNRVKPNVVAPGENIYSLTPPSIEEDGYQTMSGTSMSNPAVAGAASVVVDWYQENYGERPSPAMVRSILINTANDLNENVSDTRGSIPNQDEGWGIVDISKLEYPTEEPLPFTFQDQNTLLQTGEEKEYVIAPTDDSKPLNITLAWTDKNALDGDSDGGTPVLKNNLNLEVITPEGKVYRGNAFNETGGSQSDTGNSYPGTDTMSIFDNNANGWDDVNTVENVFLPSEEVAKNGAYTIRVIGENIPEDANNDGVANQDFALTCHNTRQPSNGVVFTDSKRYSGEDTVEIKAVDWDLQGTSNYSEASISSDSDPSGFNVSLTGDTDSQELTAQVDISQNASSEDVLQVSHGDYITVKYWDEDIGDGTGAMKSYEAWVDTLDPEPPQRFNVEWWSPYPVPEWQDNVTDGSNYTTGTSHENASTWAIRDHDSVIGTSSWDWGDQWFNKSADEGMKSWLISPEIEIPAEDPRQMGIEFTFQHWRDFGDELLYDGGNLKISTDGLNGSYEIIEPEEGYDGEILDTHDNPLGGQTAWGGEVGWETATFDVSDYAGETVHFRWDAGTEGWHDEDGDHLQGEGWRIDQLAVKEIVQGTDHNRLTWTASPNDKDVPWDDPTGHLGQYNIYRSSDKSGPWDQSNLLTSVEADRSDEYGYIDINAGEADNTRWWYVLRAEKDVGNEESNEITVPEPGGPSLSIDSPTEGEVFTTDEVTVEWTGDPQINSYEVRLNEDPPIDVGSSTQYTFTNLAEGTHKVSVTGFTPNATAYGDVKFMVDLTPPELDILSPADGEYVNESDVMIEWEGHDDISSIDHYEVRVNGGSWTEVGENTSHMLSECDHNESYQVEVRGYDMAGYTTTRMVNFTIDFLDPVVEIHFPEEEGWTGENMTTEWYGMDGVSGIDHYSIRIPEDPRYEHWIDVGTDMEYDFSDLEGGEQYTVEVIATDNAGNYNLTSSRFSVDPKPPHLDILYPEKKNESDEYHIIGKNDVEVVWSRADQYSGLSHIDIKLDNRSWNEDIGVPTSYTFTDLSNGLHTVTVRATNNARLESYDNVTFMVDTTPPSLEIISPDQKETYTTDEVTVEWEGSDDYSGLQQYDVRLNQETWIDVGLDTQYTFDDMGAQEHYVEVRAKNNAGYSRTKSVTFIVDQDTPVINILSPSDGELFDDDEVTVKWEGRDNVSGLDYYEVRLDEDTWKNVGTSPLYTFKNLEDGEHGVEVRGYDVAGNQETVSITFTVDTTSPEVEIISPEQNKIYDKDTITASWSGSDGNSGIASHEVRLNQGDWIEVDGTEHEFDGLEDGEYTFKVRVTDEAGHTSVDETSFTVDTTSPVLSISTPESNQIYDKDTITVRWSGNDETTGVSYYQVKMGEEDWIDVGKETKYEFSSVEDGEPTVTVRAIDEAGNSNEDNVQFIVDTELGELNIYYPEMYQELSATMFPSSRPVTIEWIGNSYPTDIVTYKVRINEGSWIDLGSDIHKYTFEQVPEGLHKVEVQAIDEAGNNMVDVVEFTVNINLGELNIETPEMDQEFQADIFSSSRPVTIEWSGDSYPTDNVTYKIRIDDGPWIDVGSDVNEYTFEDVPEGEHTVEIRAEYEEGNDQYQLTEEVNFEVSPGFVAAYWWLIVLIAAIIVTALAVGLRKRKKGEEEPPEPEEPESDEFEEEDFQKDEGWEEDETGYVEPAEEEGPPPAQEQPEQPPESEEVPEQEDEVFGNSQPSGEEEKPPPPDSSESTDDFMEDMEGEER